MNKGNTVNRIVTLTTDWNRHDYYQGVLVGKILSIFNDVRIIELTHDITPFDYIKASFVIKSSYKAFPPKSVHLCLVNSDSTKGNQMLLTQAENRYLLLPDNGMIGLITDSPIDTVYSFPIAPDSTFGSLDAVLTALEAVWGEKSINDFAVAPSGFKQNIPLRAASDSNSITGNVIYIDSYQNVITNINRDQFERARKGRRFTIFVQSFSYKIDTIVRSYSEVDEGELLALFNSLNLLEIAVYNGFIAELLALEVGSSIMIKFYDD